MDVNIVMVTIIFLVVNSPEPTDRQAVFNKLCCQRQLIKHVVLCVWSSVGEAALWERVMTKHGQKLFESECVLLGDERTLEIILVQQAWGNTADIISMPSVSGSTQRNVWERGSPPSWACASVLSLTIKQTKTFSRKKLRCTSEELSYELLKNFLS